MMWKGREGDDKQRMLDVNAWAKRNGINKRVRNGVARGYTRQYKEMEFASLYDFLRKLVSGEIYVRNIGKGYIAQISDALDNELIESGELLEVAQEQRVNPKLITMVITVTADRANEVLKIVEGE